MAYFRLLEKIWHKFIKKQKSYAFYKTTLMSAVSDFSARNICSTPSHENEKKNDLNTLKELI